MSEHNEKADATQPDTGARNWTRRRRTSGLIGIATVGGLALVVPQVLPAAADPLIVSSSSPVMAVAPQPPAGSSWVQGVLTDQAGHTLNNVNVEAWSTDPAATEPVASNLSYAGDPKDARHKSGVFRLQVPAGTPYEIKFSTVAGVEDGDQFRMQTYGKGRPIMTRSTSPDQKAGVSSVMALPGRTVDLGTTQLVRQGTVASKTTAKLGKAKVKVGQHGKLTVRVTSKYVSNVTGKVQARVSGKKVSDRLAAFDHGKTTIKLPKLKKGTHMVNVTFKGTNTVAPSKGKKVRLVVTKKK